MLRPPSNQKSYDEFWSGDPAFVQPDKNDEESVRAHGERVRQARLTGDWSGLLVEGRSPTKFVMRPIRQHQLDWIRDQRQRQDSSGIGDAEFWSLIFRCALVEIVNFETAGVKTKPDDHPKLGKIAARELVDFLASAQDEAGRAVGEMVIAELSLAAFIKARGLDPL